MTASGPVRKPDALVTRSKVLRHIEDKGRASLEGACIRLVSRTVLEEDSVAAANGRLAIADRVPSEANARRGGKILSLHTTCGHAIGSALNQAVQKARVGIRGIQGNGIARRQGGRNAGDAGWNVEKLAREWIHHCLGSQRGAVCLRFPVISRGVLLVPSSEKAHP